MLANPTRQWCVSLVLTAVVAACGGNAAGTTTSSAAVSKPPQPAGSPSLVATATPTATASVEPSSQASTAAPTAAANTSAICDPWLTADTIEHALDQTAVLFQDEQNPSVNEWPGPISCYWTLADGSRLRFTAGYDKDLHIVDPVLHGGVKIAGLGDAAEFDSVSGNEVLWGVGSNPAVIMTVGTAGPVATQLDQASLTSLARQVAVPAP